MTDVMPLGDDFSYQDVDMDIDIGYMDQDPTNNNVHLENGTTSGNTFGTSNGQSFGNSGDSNLETTAAQTTNVDTFGTADSSTAEAVPEKVHLRGLDTLDTGNIKTFAELYFPSEHFIRVEWVDDTGANLIYDTVDAALDALVAFTSENVDPSSLHPSQLRPAKPLTLEKNGQTQTYELSIRSATTADVKAKNAREASRFYLMNPDKDPLERRHKQGRRRPRGDRDTSENGEYRKMRYDDKEHKRRRQDDGFDASMYDDDAGNGSADEHDRRKRVRFGRRKDEDLFSGSNGRLRNRSASPPRDGDGRYGFGSDPDESSIRRKIRQRSLTPPRLRNPPISAHTVMNSGKELFPLTKGRSLGPTPVAEELFPEKVGSPKELFPNKKINHHRRSNAIDASPERYTGHERSPSLKERISGTPGSLADRITGGPGSSKLSGCTSSSNSESEFNIRGSAPINVRGSPINIRGAAPISIKGSGGMSVKGAAREDDRMEHDSSAPKELFPHLQRAKGGNQGKELFAEKLKGRGGPRRAAASFF
ncbi:hypothetical protein FKW77_007600 [Venturia effusa]|uniref:Uncharacterized protein n=1 Tax=Venturia effusa TaxID=50376 RepID=A0A517LLT8_9PEZI|nr:hypothetical protein FKW77_007600 [Venturia effusa]